MKTALVTGGAGFIGSHIVDAYLERGWRVVVIDDLSTGERHNVDRRAELYVVDIRDAASIISEVQPDLVSHHAAQIDVRKSVADPAEDADINIVGSIRLLQACVAAHVKRFIFASSGGAGYGEPVFAPQTEEHPIRPLSPYGCAKVAVESYMTYFREVHGLSTVALRYANVYGPRQNTKGEAGVIAIFADRMLRGEPVTINGSGEQTRDFVFVRDVVAASMAVTEHPELKGAYNVGTGVETSINVLYDEMAKILGTPAAAIHAPAKAGEQMRSVLDGALLRNAGSLGHCVPLAEGLRETIDFFRRS
ncbi:MAG TPA: NAD-dependent epimerase/dehydratase family protein [Thermoanaerobaculia bacterium]|nr:NAD-dependent epimerase/dehydratase family protein [Thermoanaerobaculia bacterium]